MTLFSISLFLHSLVRWVIVILVLVLIVRNSRRLLDERQLYWEWAERDENFHVWLIAALDIQLLLGLVLYFTGPTHTYLSMPGFMKDSLTRFFAVEHGFSALLAIVAAHIGRAKSRRATDARTRRRVVLISLIITALLLAFTIPWPFLRYGRSLLPHF